MKRRLSITLHEVSVRRGGRWALRGVSWPLRPGECWALLGDNGSGKTQLLKLLSGAVWPTPDERRARKSGRTYFRGGESVPLIDAKAHVAYVGGESQDKYSRYGWNLPVQDVVATGLHGTDLLLRVPTAVQIARVGKILSACGLQHLARRKFLALSYGEKRLALLARALVQDPDWLLLDEFYNGLDRNYRRRLDSLLRDVRRRGQSWVATAHRLADVPAGTHFALALAGGRVLYRKPLDRHELESLASRASETAGPASPPAPPRSRSKSPAPRSRSLEPSTNALLIALRDVDLYVEYRAVLRHVNWRLQRGEHWAVFGANGAGKSSFLKLLYGDLAPALGGRIERIGCAPGMPMAEWKRRIGLVSPELQTTYLVDVSVMEMVASARYSSIGLVDAMTRADERQALKWLDFFELTSLARRRPRELSYGQMRRALIARALATEPDILLLDEPLTGLDPANRARIKVLLRRLMRSGVSVIAAVHHPEDLPRGMTHALRLHNHRAQQIDLQSAT